MIRTEAELKSAVDFIDEDLELYDFELSEKMTSYEYNLYLQDIEYYLDVLYEKTRTIEDLIEYLDFYSSKKINEAEELLNKNRNILESSIDKFISNKSFTYNVEWDNNAQIDIIDRNGEKINGAVFNINTNNINPGFIEISSTEPTSIIKNSNNDTYSDNIDTCLKDKIYFTSYNLDSPQIIEETLSFKIDDTSELYFENYLKGINCSVSFNGINENNEAVYKLICNSPISKAENFEYKYYIDSELDSAYKNEELIYNKAKSININQNNMANRYNKDMSNEYFKTILKYQKTIDKQKESSSILNTAGIYKK